MTEDDSAEYVYSGSGGVIRIQRGLTVAQQKYYFGHEMQHALIDYLHKLVMEGATA